MSQSQQQRTWSDEENDLLVADYMTMLEHEILQQPYNKAEHNRNLQLLINRTKGSIEFKHCNLSAVLQKLGAQWIKGYFPRGNIQNSLIAAAERYFIKNPFMLTGDLQGYEGLAEHNADFIHRSEIIIKEAPIFSVHDEITSPELKRLIKKFDPAQRDQNNRELGQKGEQFVYENERQTLIKSGFMHLAKKVRWVARDDGDGAGYDILSYDKTGREKLLEVKTTNGYEKTPFYLTENELSVSAAHQDIYKIVRLYNFNKQPAAFYLKPPLEQCVSLNPTLYRASFS